MKSLHHSSERLNRWLGDRRWKIFVLCLPALLGGLILAVAAGIVLSQHADETQRRYDLLARNALARRNFEVARVASSRGLNGAKNERDRAQWIFYLAVAMNGLGQQKGARALMYDAAPMAPLGAGSIEAHLLVAQSLLSSTNLTGDMARVALANPTNALAVTLRTVEHHLLSAVAIDPGSLAANELLGRFYINIHQPEKARERLMRIYATKPETALLLAINSDMENDSSGAVQWAERALNTYEHNLIQTAPNYNLDDRRGVMQAAMIERKYATIPAAPVPHGKDMKVGAGTPPEDSPALWLGIVRLLIINGKYAAALQTLEQRAMVSSNSDYRMAIGEVCVLVAQSISSKSPGGSSARLRFIQEGLTNSPVDVNLMSLLIQAAHATDETGPLAKTMLDRRVGTATGDSAGWWHFMLGRDADTRGDEMTARRELETASKLAPKNPSINNTVAYLTLTSTNRADWERGLNVIQAVLAQNPYEPSFRSTRGMLLAQLGRSHEAVVDLEYAVARESDSTEDRRALAKILGNAGLVSQGIPPNLLGQVRELMNDGNYASALKTLERGMSNDTNAAYATAIADVCCTWVENLPLAQHAERLQLIEKGLAHEPTNRKLQGLLLQAAKVDDDSGLAAKKFMNQMAANAVGESAAEWQLVLGRDARENGDLASARQHLEIASKLDPRQTEIQIEMAMVLAGGNKGDLERGLQLIDPVVEKFPDSADFRNTRGRILARLGKNSDAADDLSFAADHLDDPVTAGETRRILAKVYDAMGKPQKAEQQRRLLGNP